MKNQSSPQPTRRQLLVMTGAAAASAPLRGGLSHLARRPKRILTLVRDAATNSVRAVERVIWVAR